MPPRPETGAPQNKMTTFVSAVIILLLTVFNVLISLSVPAEECVVRVLNSYSPAVNGVSERDKDGFSDKLEDFLLLANTALDNIGCGVKAYTWVECGSSVGLSDFVDTEKNSVMGIRVLTDLSAIPLHTQGYYPVEIETGEKKVTSILFVCDTVSPEVTATEKQLWSGDEPLPESFVSSCHDATKVSYSFKGHPNFKRTGTRDLTVVATDDAGNSTAVTTRFTVLEDTEPPVITGAADRTVYIGDTVQYKENVAATDNRDGEVQLSVDIRGVNPNEEGSYPVVYSATDSTGLTSSLTVTFNFMYSDESLQLMKLDELLDPIYNRIIKDDMTDREKARAIYDWVRGSINYAGTSDKSSWYACAIEGITTKNGDCYTYFALSKALLTKAGIENLDVIRRDSEWHPRSKHFWNMVVIDGNWYHFDATPRSDGTQFFLVTTKKLMEYSNTHLYSHDIDTSLYPETP